MGAMIVVAVSGWSGAGKTRLMTALIREFRARGRRVLAAKHAGHDVTLQPEAKDSRAYLDAGAETAAVLCGTELLQVSRRPDFAEAARSLREQWRDYDVVLLEGRAFRDIPFVEVLSSDNPEIRAPGEQLVAAVSDEEDEYPGTHFRWDDIERLTDFLEEHHGL